MPIRVTNMTRGTILADRLEEATRVLARIRGLIGRKELPIGGGLHLVPCNSIHTFLMRFPIDVVFLDARGTVVALIAALPPWRATRIYPSARSVLELPAGVTAGSHTAVGDRLALERTSENQPTCPQEL